MSTHFTRIPITVHRVITTIFFTRCIRWKSCEESLVS